MNVEHLTEPELEFGGGERHVDIRFGLMNYGPLDTGTPGAPAAIKVGVVGTPQTIEGVTRWLERCRDGIDAKKSRQPNLFPRFPGFSRGSAFGVDLVLDEQLRASLQPRTVVNLAAKAARPGGVDAAVDLFLDECRQLAENAQPDVLVCAPPYDLLDALDRTDEPEVVGDETDDEDEGEDAPRTRRRAFHDVLKARGMALSVPIQMVRPGTYGVTRPKGQIAVRQVRVQDEATRAWNFHVALYYKAGGTPWRIARESDEFATCYVGVSFYKTPDEEHMMTSMAQVFNARGDGVIVRGGPARFEKDDRRPHLSEEDARNLLTLALRTYHKVHRTVPARVVVHKSSDYNAGELTGFRAAADEERVSGLDLLSLRPGTARLFRVGYYPPLRGTLLGLDERSYALYLKGSVDFYTTWPGMYVPRPVDVRLEEVEQTGRFLCQEVLALSKQNWNDTQFDGGWPITLRAAHQVGAILKHLGEHDQLQPRYSFYM